MQSTQAGAGRTALGARLDVDADELRGEGAGDPLEGVRRHDAAGLGGDGAARDQVCRSPQARVRHMARSRGRCGAGRDDAQPTTHVSALPSEGPAAAAAA